MKRKMVRASYWIGAAIVGCVLALYSQGVLQTGYLVMTADGGNPAPTGAALFSYSTNGVLVSQAGVASAEPIRTGRIFVDEGAVRTGLSVVNLSALNATTTLILRDAAGAEAGRQPVVLAAGQRISRFVSELFPLIPPGFSGSLTFESDSPLASLTLRESRNGRNEPVYTTLPVADLSTASSDPVVFPHIAAGGGYTTQIILINRSAAPIRGRVRLFGDAGLPLPLQISGVAVTDFEYQIAPNGVYRVELGSPQLSVGYAVAAPESGDAPSGTAIFQFKSGGQLVTEAGVAATAKTTLARIFVDHANSRTGFAIANSNSAAADVSLTLMDRFGVAQETRPLPIPAFGHRAAFVHEIFPGLQEGFTGILEIGSTTPISPITLKLAVNARSETVLTTLPVADLAAPRTQTSAIFPQVAFGGGFSTRLIFVNPDRANETIGRMRFYLDDGSAFTLPMGGIQASQFDYRFTSGGARQFLPGNTARPADMTLLDGYSATTTEVTINEGERTRPSLLVTDETGAFRDDFDVSLSSSNSDVAEVLGDGTILGKVRGFSTLSVSAGGTVKAFVATVTGIGAGSSGFGAGTGIEQDSGQRLYLVNTEQHTILLSQSLTQAPGIFAGTDRTPGFRNELRLQSQFHDPAYLAINFSDGSLYVSDTTNNVIRRVGPGAGGRVDTLAGVGVPGGGDGSTAEAAFNGPRGVAFDDKGQLWVADSNNHTIRRINLSSQRVVTVAGTTGQAGLVDASGAAARFRTPAGLTVEPESFALQLERDRRGLPPPPVRILVADAGNNVIRRVYEDGRVETFGAPSPGALVIGESTEKRRPGLQNPLTASSLLLNAPEDVAADPFGTIYVTEPASRQVRAILPTGDVVAAAGAGTFSRPKGVAVSQSGRLVVADANPREVRYGEPAITSIKPERIDSRGGARITIQGRNFAPGTLVVIGGVVMTSIDAAASNTETITFAAPPLPSGRTTLSVQNRGGLAQAPLLIDAVSINDLPAGYITTVAGGSTYAGDGAPAPGAALTPSSLVLDAGGNLLIADLFNHRIRRVDARTGIITSVAGNGQYSFSGDGGLAIGAALDTPTGIAVDSSGNLFISDSYNQRVRRVDARTGVITTVAGTGLDGFSGDGGPATAADLNNPMGLAVDAAGNLFIADTLNHRIRRVDRSGVIRTVAGNGQATFGGDNGPASGAALNIPAGLSFDGQGRLLIADTGNNRIRRLDANGIITTIAGNGQNGFSVDGTPALSSRLGSPKSAVTDVEGALYIAESDNCRVRKVGADLRITTLAGGGCGSFGDGGPGTSAGLTSPYSVAVDSAGNVFIADRHDMRVRRVDGSTGIISTFAGDGEGAFLGDNGPATSAVINYPLAMAFANDGSLYIGDSDNRVRRIDFNSGIITVMAGGGASGEVGDGAPATQASVWAPAGLAFDRSGNLYIADTGHSIVRRVDAQTRIITTIAGTGEESFSGDGGPAVNASLNFPRNLAIDAAGNLFIADDGNQRIRKVDLATGIITTYAGNGQRGFSGDGGPATAARISADGNLALDPAGNLYIADYENARIRKIDRAGIITTVAGGSTLDTAIVPIAVTTDRAGALYVMELERQAVVRIEANGAVKVVAGNGLAGFSGDAGPAILASISYPTALAVDASGNLFIADANNNRIRVVKAPIP